MRFFLLVSSWIFYVFSLHAATYFVTNTNDSGPGSFREALTQVSPSDTIEFSSSLTGTITLLSPLPWISSELFILGPTSGSVTIDGQNLYQILFIQSGDVEISNLTFSNGNSTGGNGGASSAAGGGGGMGGGGAIFCAPNGSATLSSVAFSQNSAQGGNGGDAPVTPSASVGGGGGGGLNGGGGAAVSAQLAGGGGGGGGGYASAGGAGDTGGGGGGGVTAVFNGTTISGNGGAASGATGGDGGKGFNSMGAAGGAPMEDGMSADPNVGGGGGGAGGGPLTSNDGGTGGNAGAIGGGGGGGGGDVAGTGGAGFNWGGGGGGGGSVVSTNVGPGGAGGVGGGGGAGGSGATSSSLGNGGSGGFGGGGGGASLGALGGLGGTHGGSGGNAGGGGGGGAGLGGALFVASGASILIQDNSSPFSSNSVAGGSGGSGANVGTAGEGVGADLFVMQGGEAIFTNSGDLSFSLHVGGQGTISKRGSGNITLVADTSANNALIHLVEKGQLTFSGIHGGNVHVASGAIAAGAPSIASLNNSGTISLGPTIQTYPISGGFLQRATGVLEIKIDSSGNNDLLQLGDAAYLGGTLNIIPAMGIYTSGTTYTFITTPGPVFQTFSNLVITPPSINVRINYLPNAVQIVIE